MQTRRGLHITGHWAPILRSARLDTVNAWLADERVSVWRDIRERQNGTIELGGLRFHVKRLRPPHGGEVESEVAGIGLLEAAGIPTVPLVAWGETAGGAGVVVTHDLAGFSPADQLVSGGQPFARFLEPTATLAAKLHSAGLHHRDLYLCHFLFNDTDEARLIDAARVRRLPWLSRRRWVVKDLAQFRYSAREAGAKEQELDRWLEIWLRQMGIAEAQRWRAAVLRKVAAIARHDRNLAVSSPERYRSLRS